MTNARRRFDVIVMGGGPAGTATALALVRGGHAVVVLERSCYRAWRVGEFLWPWVRPFLEQLGVWDRFRDDRHHPCHAIYSAWGGEALAASHFIFNPYGQGWHLDRRRFDAMLADAAGQAGAVVLRGAECRSVIRRPDRWRVAVKHEGRTLAVEAPFVVDATGRARKLARACGSRWIAFDQEIGLIGVLVHSSSDSAGEGVLLLESVEDGWWYSCPLPDGSLVLAYMTDGDYLTTGGVTPTAFWKAKLRATNHMRSAAEGYMLEDKVRVRAASTGRLDRAAGPGWVAVGDSASTFDPLTGSGIPKALQYALLVARSIGEQTAGHHAVLDEYADGVARDFEEYWRQRTAYCRMEQRWPASLFWRRRQPAAA